MRNLLIAVAVLVVWTGSVSAEWKEGLWEITSKVDMPGMPKDIPATTMQQCITKKDMTPMPTNRSGGTECTRKEQKLAGDTVTYLMECKSKDGGTMESGGKMTFKGNSFEGTSVTTMTRKGQPPMKMNGKMSGKYLGPCAK
ncbi:MAG TPA: DUF3617 family protein [Syntrophorhabdaceae bacterium]|jgi:hypothetical protein